MLVKKFEAPTMKEALELVKTHLGPEAIILSAKDNNQGFGLVGKSSVEVTAAVSETQIKKRQIAEARLRPTEKDRLRSSPARMQKQFIQKSMNRYLIDDVPSTETVIAKPTRYIDIGDDQIVPGQSQARRQSFVEESPQNANESKRRVREAARSAFSAAQATFQETKNTPVRSQPIADYSAAAKIQSQKEILSLKSEIEQLKGLLENLKRAPTHSLSVSSLHPGAHEGLPYEMSFLYTRLTESGISAEFATAICKKALTELSAEQSKKKSLVDAWAAKNMMSEILLTTDAHAQGLHVFVGGSGHGKTSALVRMASHLVIREHKSVAIVTTDTRRVGAAEQLRIYAQILNVPFAIIRSKSDWVQVLANLRGTHSILVDNPGLSLKNLEEIDLIQSLMPPADHKKTVHMVMSINQKDADAYELGRRYRLLHMDDVIFTKLDESVNHGLIYNFQKEFKLPLHSFGIGPMIPEDYELATKERVIDLVFKISKLKNT